MYAPIVLSADRRWRLGMQPLRVLNWFAQPLPAEAGKPGKACLLPTPGRVQRVDLGASIQGVYREAGVRGGALFVVAGAVLYAIASDWTATAIGSIDGTGDACFAGLRDTLYVARNAKPYRWNGVDALSQVADVDAPNAAWLLVLAQRLVAGEAGADTFFWSDTLDGTAWEALGFATSEQRPDAAYANVRVSGQIIALGEASLEVLRSTGNAQLPFANVTAQSIEESEGVLGPAAFTAQGDKLYLIGGNLRGYVMSGFALQELPTCGALEDDLTAMSEADRRLTTLWSYSRGTNEFVVVRPKGRAAHVFDASTQLWHQRQTWEKDEYAPRWHARAYGYDVVADEGGTKLYTLEEGVFTDAGDVIERTATLRVGSKEQESVGSLCVDLQAFGRPLTGQGAAPRLMVSIATDGRSDRDDSRSEVTMEIGPDGVYRKPTLWGVGDIPPGEGATITFRMTDPAGCSLYGAWLNEGELSP